MPSKIRRARGQAGRGAEALGKRGGDEPVARRSRRSLPLESLEWDDGTEVKCGQRVSRIFEHERRNIAFEGTIVKVHVEFRSCDVDFDDGTSSRSEHSKLTRR